MNKKIKILTTMVVLASAFGVLVYTNAQTSRINLSITAGVNTYNISGFVTLPSRTSSFTAVSKDVSSGNFQTNSFVAQDLKGTDTWNVTLRHTDLVGPNGTISSGNIYIRLNTAVSLTGDATCGANTTLTSSWTGLNADRIMFQKSGNGKVCKIAMTPTVGVDIPASQAVGDYISTGNFFANLTTINGSLTY